MKLGDEAHALQPRFISISPMIKILVTLRLITGPCDKHVLWHQHCQGLNATNSARNRLVFANDFMVFELKTRESLTTNHSSSIRLQRRSNE